MALFSKAQGILKQNLTKEIATSSSIIRWMSSSILFVGGIPNGMDDVSLKEFFSDLGEVTKAKVVLDRVTGQSRGFGFVSYASAEDAAKAIQVLDLKKTRDRTDRIMKVRYASYMWDPPKSGRGGRGYDRGGFGRRG